MMRWIRGVLILVAKEALVEWRGRELVTLLVCNALLMALLTGAGVSSAMMGAALVGKIYPWMVWVLFILVTTTSVARLHEHELDGRGYEGLFLCGVTGAQLYVAKVIVLSGVFLGAFALLSAALMVVLNQHVWHLYGTLLGVGAGCACAIASLLVLIAAIASTSKVRGLLVPIMALPLLFPIFFAGAEMTTEICLRGALDAGSAWPVIVFCATVLYGVVGVNLYEVAVRE